MKRTIELTPTITLNLSLSDDGRFTASGTVYATPSHRTMIHGGQCLDDIKSDDPLFVEIRRLWRLYHLNDMHPECHHQHELGWTELACKPVVFYRHTLTTDTISQQNALKRASMTRLCNGESVCLSENEKTLLGLKYEVKTTSETPPSEYYRYRDNETKTLGWVHPEEHPDGILTKPCPVCGYKYGTSWIKFDIPDNDLVKIRKIIETGEL